MQANIELQLVDNKGQVFNYAFQTEAEYDRFMESVQMLPQGIFRSVNLIAH